jgi:hypothetical protein
VFSFHTQLQSRAIPPRPAFLLRSRTEHRRHPRVALAATEVGSTNCPRAEPPVASRRRERNWPRPSYRAGAFLHRLPIAVVPRWLFLAGGPWTMGQAKKKTPGGPSGWGDAGTCQSSLKLILLTMGEAGDFTSLGSP